MHISEIIFEAIPVDPAVRKSRLARAQTATMPKAAPVAPKASKVASAQAAGSKIQGLIKQVILRDRIGGVALETKMAQSLGGALRIIKYFNFFQIAEELWQQKVAIETLVAEKQISQADGAAAYRMQIEKMVVAIIATGGFASLIRGLKYVPLLKWVVRGGAVVATGASLGTLGAPSVALALASEAGAIWLQNFLESAEGQKALAYWVIYFIDPSVTWLWNMGPGKIFGAWATASDNAQEKLKTLPDKTQPAAKTNASTTGQGARPATDTNQAPSATTQAPTPPGGWAPSDPYANLPSTVGTKDVKIY